MPFFNKPTKKQTKSSPRPSDGETEAMAKPPRHPSEIPSAPLPPSSCIAPSVYEPHPTALPQPTAWKVENTLMTIGRTELPAHTQCNTQRSPLPQETVWKPENTLMTIGRTELPAHTTLMPATMLEGGQVASTALPAKTEFKVERRDIAFSVLPPKSKEVVRH